MAPELVADLCLIDPFAEHVIRPEQLRSKSRNSPFIGKPLTGRVELTMARGSIVYRREATDSAAG